MENPTKQRKTFDEALIDFTPPSPLEPESRIFNLLGKACVLFFALCMSSFYGHITYDFFADMTGIDLVGIIAGFSAAIASFLCICAVLVNQKDF